MTRKRWALVLGALATLVLATAFATARAIPGLPENLPRYLLGPKLVRAEVVVLDGGVLHDYRIDRGRIRALTRSSITIRERDGSIVTIPFATTARIRLNGRPAGLAALRRGMMVLTVRDGDAPAERIEVTK
jgi:hypothetical protein